MLVVLHEATGAASQCLGRLTNPMAGGFESGRWGCSFPLFIFVPTNHDAGNQGTANASLAPNTERPKISTSASKQYTKITCNVSNQHVCVDQPLQKYIFNKNKNKNYI